MSRGPRATLRVIKAGECLNQGRILVVSVDPIIRSGICDFLTAHGHTVTEASSCRDGHTTLQQCRPHAAVLDLSLPNGDAPELLREMKSDYNVPVVVLTSQSTAEMGAQAIQQGAEQFLLKPVDLSALHALLLRFLRPLKSRVASTAPASNGRWHLNPFLGSSPAIRNLQETATRVLASESPILLQGETGSGKGVLAKWIHRKGTRPDQPFLDLNCAGLSRELLESELFGYEKGAFTSAVASKQGLLEVANGGTVFLDEIGDIDLQVQPKLLKVLEDRMFRRLGDVHDRSVDIHLISATHRDLLEQVRQQKFRSDLYFRVNICYIHVPALRERVEDIPVLSKHLLGSISRNYGRQPMGISEAALLALQRYSWPGNIRELRNVLERAALLSEPEVIGPEHLHFQGTTIGSSARFPKMSGTLKEVEQSYIQHVLYDENGSIERAARRLGIPRSSLYNKMKRFDIPCGTGRE
jgi:DNA-binding NtrC family response regulator